MSRYMLDIADAGLLQSLLFFGLLFIVFATLIEAVVMILMAYNLAFKKAIGDSLLANGASLAVGLVLMAMDVNIFDFAVWVNFLILYAITVLLELIVLYVRNRQKPFTMTLMVCMLMNIVSYAMLYLITIT